MKLSQWIASAVLLAGFATTAMAQNVTVTNAWVRASVQGQNATGAFMSITARENVRLMGASSPVAGVAELHEMKMDGGVMKMRAVEGGLEIPAGKTVDLESGRYHVMLMDLKAALPKDSTVPLTLVFKDSKGVQSRVELQLPVALSAMKHKH
ncbi:MAG: copper chaperone PCu(A)C [Betaproteobacteria bacterium]